MFHLQVNSNTVDKRLESLSIKTGGIQFVRNVFAFKILIKNFNRHQSP